MHLDLRAKPLMGQGPAAERVRVFNGLRCSRSAGFRMAEHGRSCDWGDPIAISFGTDKGSRQESPA